MKFRFSSFGVHLALLATLIAGCGWNSIPSLEDVVNTNIKKVRSAYAMYMLLHGLNGPKDEESFKEFLKTDPSAKVRLQRIGITPETVEDMFISGRDGQPFKIRYGLVGRGDYPIVFEATGVNGKRFVALAEPREIDAQEYEQLWSMNIKDFAPMGEQGITAGKGGR